MARLPYAQSEDPADELNLLKMLAHSPPVLRGFKALGGALLMQLELPPRLREAAIIRTGLLAGASYEVTKHLEIGSWVGLTEGELAALDPKGDAQALEPSLRAIVKLADELHAGGRGSEETVRELRVHLSDREVVEAVVTTGFYAMVCRVLETLEIDLEAPLQAPAE
jgi:4-carboxymuconolactone decarboxylase